MVKIVHREEVESVIFLPEHKKKIVVVGGCFDIVHIGHIQFLKEAKKCGDVLILLLESDENVRKLKGENRPVFTQRERAEVLSALSPVDFVILLPLMTSDADYNHIITTIKPHIIAVTEHDPLMKEKEKQAKRVGGKIAIIPFVKTFSSSKLAKLLGID